MKIPRLALAMGYIDDDLIVAAEEYKPKAKQTKKFWKHFAAIAACICIVMIGATVMLQPNIFNSLTGTQNTPNQPNTLTEPATIHVEIVEWRVDGFRAVVIDDFDNGIFPQKAELTVRFDENTDVILTDGSVLHFDPDNPNTDMIGWKTGTIVAVKFTDYDEYLEGNHFYNQLYANSVEQKSK